jgi:hypothetical protein
MCDAPAVSDEDTKSAEPTEDDLIGTAEVMRLANVADRSTVTRWVEQGKLTPVGRLGAAGAQRRGAFVFRRADVEAFLEDKHQIEASA